MLLNRPNVILLTIDTLRADVLSCYGYSRPTTPNLDRLAASGIRFTQAITGGSWTQAAFPVLLTSSYGSMYGGCLGPLAPERPSPIETLADHGYITGGFSTSPLLSKTYGYDRGFRHFADLAPNESDPLLRRIRGGQRLLWSPVTHYVSGIIGRRLRPARMYVPAAQVTDNICRWLENAESPFFVWGHYMDIHWPYHREEVLIHPKDIAQAWRDLAHLNDVNWHGNTITDAQRDHYIRLYEQALQYTDAQIGRLLDYLDNSGYASNTIVIIASDHGEEFLEHGRWGHWENNLYDEILKVPLIIHLPGQSGEQVIHHQVRTLDIIPTVLDLCDCPAPVGIEGTSLVPLWTQSEAKNEAEEAISEMWRDSWHIVAIRTEAFKYIWGSKRPDQPELYDLRADPGEKHNTSKRYPQEVDRFQGQVDAHLSRVAETQPATAVAEPELDEKVLRRLRDLGYVE
jgi:arylsulfatase A-like enzyme